MKSKQTDNDIIFTSDKSPCDPKEKYDTFHSNEQLDLPEMIKSCQTFDTERKSSNDSMSNCGSQNDTLSQTSESSFFLSVVNPNKSQTNSTSEGAQNEKKIEKNKKIPFFYGIEEYYRKLMPEKFTEYKKSKNFVSKSSCLKKVDLEPNVEKNEKINMNNKKEENKQNQNTNMLQYQNCFYLSCYGIFYPVNPANFNSFYFNNFSNIFTKNYNKNDKKKENYIANEKNEENEKEDEEQNESKQEQEKEKETIINKEEICENEENKENDFLINRSKYKNKRFLYQKYYYKNPRYNYFVSQRYSKKYNKFSYYNSNSVYFEEKSSYYSSYYSKRRFNNDYDNKYYNYI